MGRSHDFSDWSWLVFQSSGTLTSLQRYWGNFLLRLQKGLPRRLEICLGGFFSEFGLKMSFLHFFPAVICAEPPLTGSDDEEAFGFFQVDGIPLQSPQLCLWIFQGLPISWYRAFFYIGNSLLFVFSIFLRLSSKCVHNMFFCELQQAVFFYMRIFFCRENPGRWMFFVSKISFKFGS